MKDFTSSSSPKKRHKEDGRTTTKKLKSSSKPKKILKGKDKTTNINMSLIPEKIQNYVCKERDVRPPSQRHSRESSNTDKPGSNSRDRSSETCGERKGASTSNKKNRDIQIKDRARSKSDYQEERSHKAKDRNKSTDQFRNNEVDHSGSKTQKVDGVRDVREKKKRSCLMDSEERCSKRRRDDCRDRSSSSSEKDRFQIDDSRESEDCKSYSTQEHKRVQENVTGRLKGEHRPKHRIPSDEGEIFSTSSSSPNERDDSSQDGVIS
uniref:Uncharacterized protein n=1 Tax=Lygus hesperus TaxID=30085 RepID=A0A0K8S5P5_LYGHE